METIMHVNDKLQFHGYDTFSGSDMQLGSSLTGMIPFLGSSTTLPLLCNAAEKMKKDEGSHPMLIDSAPSFGHLSYNGFFESNTHAAKSRPKQEDAAAAPSSFLKQFPWPDCDAYSEVVLSPLNNFAEQQFGEGEFISPLLSGLDSYKSLSSLSDESRMGNVDSFWFHSNPDSNGFGYLSNAFPTLMGLDQVQYAQEGMNPLSIPLYYNYGADMGTSSSLQLFPSNSVAFGAESTYKPRIHEFYADSNGQEGDTQTTTSNSNESQCRSDLSEQKESRKRPLEITSGHSSCESKRAHLDICGSNGSKKATYWISCSDDKARTTCSSKTHAFPVINGSTKTKGRQSNANDPQSIAARHRRERISERLKILQDLVPNSSKVDLVTMLEKAINYVKFLQLQVRVLTTDEYWPNLEKNSSKTSTAKESQPAAEETSEVEQ